MKNAYEDKILKFLCRAVHSSSNRHRRRGVGALRAPAVGQRKLRHATRLRASSCLYWVVVAPWLVSQPLRVGRLLPTPDAGIAAPHAWVNHLCRRLHKVALEAVMSPAVSGDRIEWNKIHPFLHVRERFSHKGVHAKIINNQIIDFNHKKTSKLLP
jgi:hypothetical protein